MEAKTLLALDVATVTGVAEWEPGCNAPRFYSIRFASPGDEHTETFARARRWTDERLSVGDVAAVYLEAPVSPGILQGQTNAETIFRLVGLWAVISAAVKVWRIKYRDVNVQKARMRFFGKGHLKREEAKARAMQMAQAVGWAPNNFDEADAAVVLFYAMTEEAPNYAPLISPMLQNQVATSVENTRLLRDREKRERVIRRAG